MSIATFSLPIDIPWQRIAFSDDMIDRVACDRELPSRWRSSVAVFEYEPPEDQQRSDDFRVTYLKVSCTITGFQERGQEIRIRERLGRSGWTNKDLTDRLAEDATKYHPCYGAILEVVVAPHKGDDRFTPADYPYFSDFDPKKRELYEVVTETGEVMSRSLENAGVRHGQTTLSSHTVRDDTTIAGEIAGAYGNAQSAGQISAKGSASNTSGTTDLTQQGTENVRTSDAAREARETFSHTTQLSQMYHQLDSYHLGTNRAAFFILPRPHVVQSPFTFVNGPRQIEGVQEFMLVVVRPKRMEHFCVEAYLETAHLVGAPILDWEPAETQLHLQINAPTTDRVLGSTTSIRRPGYVIDRQRGPQGVPLGGFPHGDTGGYNVDSVNIPPAAGGDYTFIVGEESVTVNGWAEGSFTKHPEKLYPGSLELNATVYLKKKVPNIVGREPGLMITGRAVCSCAHNLVSDPAVNGPSVVYEKSLPKAETQRSAETQRTHERASMSISEANLLGANLKNELLQSLSSADRYPRGTVGLLDSQLMASPMAAHLRHAEPDVNTRLSDWPGINQKLAYRVTAYDPSITRSQMLEMPLAQQVERFGLSFADAVELRRALMDLAEPQGPPPMPERKQIQVPLLMGLQLNEARAALAAAGLAFGTATVVDSPLPSDSVVAQDPEAGASVDSATEVSVQTASGLSVRLPEVVGLHLSEAMCRLRDAGLRSEPTIEGRAVPDASVMALEPYEGTLVTPNTAVTISLERKAHGHHRDKS